ncbi:UDP-N-acetylmuramoyl-L-alanyl-D-glutamate--2,6-diaminopimelate ligase [Alkalidesulfovibrio alkalitolerans DSM 16529]|uniref:UDP-N-acetylmuramoyl-L-alanyl-D-glutamate--2,6-diaminopimelate ligase n=1 Tax=Alkalidesulfovibrio alkalitolerans DSM 16529 TaxID=1121439 RepID=S7TEV8_9BACT|nr:UDP-N-acetylmuramoyl-L-alanyl-D-glutamate--2,6-diaminopimelate ligase [Alkalidesulfovibrio alkalitolerans]EPR35135.1 UDP-N-acetylmuramoyl-L-alanyl-D-glutamate--2,6-diaminopimelate ligase [Alkalidesulfovibrio alkalitolerans DSM 16529]
MTTDSRWSELLDRVGRGLMVWTHSGKIRPGDVFVALPGARVDGSAYIPEALRRGAGYVVAKSAEGWPADLARETGAELVLRPDPSRALGELARAFFKTDAHPFKLVGVTGTNGKTTTTYLIEYLMHANNRRVGVLGTINYRWPGVVLESQLTTPDCWKLHELLANMARAKVEAVVMEASSHALDQGRVAGLSFDVAVMTNLTQDHLDYHGTMEAYFAAKTRLFTEYAAPQGTAVLNWDDPSCAALLKTIPGAMGYGLTEPPQGDFKPLQGRLISSTAAGMQMEVLWEDRKIAFTTPLVGRHNAQNLLAAFAAGLSLGLPLKAVKELEGFHGVPGRLERVPNDKGLNVFVDYAHTPDALENVLAAITAIGPRKLYVVFGCGGDRDRTKRPLMGRAVCKWADVAVLTSDNPRHEDPLRIMDDVRPGLSSCKRIIEEVDRREAIRLALKEIGPEDVLVVAGKGHEMYQQIGDLKFPFNDANVVREVLQCS